MNEDYTAPFFCPHDMAVRLGKKTSFYLPPLEPRQIPPEPSPVPTMDYFPSGRISNLEHEVTFLKKGYRVHTYKKRTLSNKYL